MSDGKVGDYDDVDGLRGIAEVGRDSLLDVVMEFIKRAALSKDVLPEAPGAPVLPVKVSLNLDQHVGEHRIQPASESKPFRVDGEAGKTRTAAPQNGQIEPHYHPKEARATCG